MPKRRVLTKDESRSVNGRLVYERKIRKLPPNWKKGAEKRKLLIRELMHNGNDVASACAVADCSRAQFNYYRREYPEFDLRVDEIAQQITDRVEGALLKQILEDNNTSATQFYLKTKGRERGYAEKTEHKETREINVNFSYGITESDKLNSVKDKMVSELEAQQRKLEDGDL